MVLFCAAPAAQSQSFRVRKRLTFIYGSACETGTEVSHKKELETKSQVLFRTGYQPLHCVIIYNSIAVCKDFVKYL